MPANMRHTSLWPQTLFLCVFLSVSPTHTRLLSFLSLSLLEMWIPFQSSHFHLPDIFILFYLLPVFQPQHFHSAPASTTMSRSCLHLSLLTVFPHLSSSSSSTPVISKSHLLPPPSVPVGGDREIDRKREGERENEMGAGDIEI